MTLSLRLLLRRMACVDFRAANFPNIDAVMYHNLIISVDARRNVFHSPSKTHLGIRESCEWDTLVRRVRMSTAPLSRGSNPWRFSRFSLWGGLCDTGDACCDAQQNLLIGDMVICVLAGGLDFVTLLQEQPDTAAAPAERQPEVVLAEREIRLQDALAVESAAAYR